MILKEDSEVVKTDTINIDAFKFIVGAFMDIKLIYNSNVKFETKFFIGFHPGVDKSKGIFIANTWVSRCDKQDFTIIFFLRDLLDFFIREILEGIFKFYTSVWRKSNGNKINRWKEIFIINFWVWFKNSKHIAATSS